MCHFKTWYFDEHGYVVSCEHCNHFQVCFGTTMLTLSPTDYEVFVKMVAQKKEDHVTVCDLNIRCVILPTPCSNIRSFLSEQELDTLNTMLQTADNEMKAQELISLF